jgi:hypothetical protein
MFKERINGRKELFPCSTQLELTHGYICVYFKVKRRGDAL